MPEYHQSMPVLDQRNMALLSLLLGVHDPHIQVFCMIITAFIWNEQQF